MLKVAQQRLGVAERHRRVELRAVRREQVGRVLAAVVPRRRDRPAEPGQVPACSRRWPSPSGSRPCRRRSAARWAAARCKLFSERRVHDRLVGAVDGRQRVVEGLRVDALDGDVEVALERARHGLVDGQLGGRRPAAASLGASVRLARPAWPPTGRPDAPVPARAPQRRAGLPPSPPGTHRSRRWARFAHARSRDSLQTQGRA